MRPLSALSVTPMIEVSKFTQVSSFLGCALSRIKTAGPGVPYPLARLGRELLPTAPADDPWPALVVRPGERKSLAQPSKERRVEAPISDSSTSMPQFKRPTEHYSFCRFIFSFIYNRTD
ncbi:hypothetical protein RRG08_042378 [Elysia crispata]|uniref:Uncharacterized protein n=1 Tax=Elysia crispata TaxID=231223 RepID=A0AAE0ZBV9_9GAST|nr:hypothetical protein RRG08_042378 [Elysia crispata]